MARSNLVLRAPAAAPTEPRAGAGFEQLVMQGEVDDPGKQQVIKGTHRPQADSGAEDGALANAMKVKSCQPKVEGGGSAFLAS